ncbi:acyltransferase [Roseomonas sp. WA12]
MSEPLPPTDEPPSELERDYLRRRLEYQPWLAGRAGEEERREQEEVQRILARHAGAKIGKGCFVSALANIFTDRLVLGDRSWIAAGAILRGIIRIGSQSTINPYAHIAGRVTIGSGVRIAGGVALYGFNHGSSRLDQPIHRQPRTSKGIVIGDGSWIGANSLVVDGVSIGQHCIVAGGAVVTASFPDYSVLGGNPARLIRNRQEGESTA